jgi:cation/acetate symporter
VGVPQASEIVVSLVAISCFAFVIVLTLGITWVAASRTRSADDFYIAGGNISGTQNGLAIAGDFMSAATLLGTSAMIFEAGYDAAIYLGASMVAFTLFVFLMTDKLQALGRYTFTDILCTRLNERPIRIVAATTALVSALMYLMVQVVGAGALIQILFGIDYWIAVVLVSVLMVLYVSVGGMLATTWVQITKAVLLLIGITALAGLTLLQFDFDFTRMYDAAYAQHDQPYWLSAPGGLQLDLVSSLSLGLGLVFGLLGSPHLLMRFFTVADAYQARKSALVAMSAVSYVNGKCLCLYRPGVCPYLQVHRHLQLCPTGVDDAGGLHGFCISFATILAVVAGLTLASVSAISHDLYAGVIRKGQADEQAEIRVSRIATIVLGILVILLGLAFEGQNVAYLVSLALAVAASTNFPMLILTMYWQRFTTRAAIYGGLTGLFTTVTLVVLGPAVWVNILGNSTPLFPSAYPALYAMGAAFAVMIFLSLTTTEPRRDQLQTVIQN